MRHLDGEGIESLQAGEPAAVAYFREHLAAPCEACEEALAQDRRLFALDGEVDRILLALAPRAEAPLDEVGFQRVWREVRLGRSRSRVWAAAAASVALAAALVIVPRFVLDGGEPGLKGGPRVSVELSAAVRAQSGEIRRVDPGATIEAGGVLLLRYRAGESGTALLLREDPAGGAPVAMGTFALLPGIHDLATPEGLAGVPLAGEAGPLRLWLVTAPGAEPPSLAAAREAIAGRAGEGLTVAPLSLQVEPIHH